MRTLLMIIVTASILVTMMVLHRYYDFKRRNRELLLRNFRNNLQPGDEFENSYGQKFVMIKHIDPDHVKAYKNGQTYIKEFNDIYPVKG